MDTFTLTIKLGNDAMQAAEDVARALRTVSIMLDDGYTEGRVMDENGNSVGTFALA
jgi:hypothetical protein